MATTTRQAFARRGFDAYGEPLTFTSWDRADNQPWGWVKGWFAEGHVLDGYALTHVSEPSWRCKAPAICAERSGKRAA